MALSTNKGIEMDLEAILGRPEAPPDIEQALDRIDGARVVITGGYGSIGSALFTTMRGNVISTDLSNMDVRDNGSVLKQVKKMKPDIIFHMAADKHAPIGEERPTATTLTNVFGTENVLEAADLHGADVVVASTCKAADPETAYGASKLIAEKITLNAGQAVARLYNVVETSGNVFEIWANTEGPIPVTKSARLFISLREAVALILWCGTLPSGRYGLTKPLLRSMPEIAAALYPDRQREIIPLRRGDRLREPRLARCEIFEPIRLEDSTGLKMTFDLGIGRIVSPHDEVSQPRKQDEDHCTA
jgi:FlaA1/EpsC-like NDP-sugar epimerase